MLQSKKGNFIIALILALALWTYVTMEMNPETSTEYRNVPIQLTNEAILNEEDMAVAGVDASEMKVTLSGKRSVMARVTAEDITATVDVSEASLGENEMKIHIKVPGNTYVSEQSITEVTVKVEKRVTDTKPVKVKYIGSSEDGLEPATVGIDPETVEVAGVETKVSSVAYVEAPVKLSRVEESESSVDSTLVAKDRHGKEVESVTLSQDKATVSSILYGTKEVALDVPVDGATDEKYERTVDAPETMTIKGDSALLEGIDTITTEEVDISDVTKSGKVRITPILPEGIQAAEDSEDLYIKVSVESLVSEDTVTLEPENIGISGVGDGLTAEVVSSDITVTLTGTAEALASADADSISASCDVTDLKEGTHKVDLKVSCSAKGVQVDDHTGKVEVKITGTGEKQQEKDEETE